MLSVLSDEKRRVVGIKQLMKKLQAGQIARVFVAQDAEQSVTRPIEELCLSQAVPVEKVSTMKELGRACRIQVGAAAAGLLRQSQ